MRTKLWLAGLVVGCLLVPGTLDAQGYPNAESITELRKEYRNHYARTGQYDKDLADRFLRQVNAALEGAPPGKRHSFLYELGKMQRLHNQYEDAIASLTAAATDAPDDSETEFKSWVEIASLHAARADHDAAAMAFEHAVQAAGTERTRAERFDLAHRRAEIESERGEHELALADALDALRLAETLEDRFNANYQIGFTLKEIAFRCEHQPIIDSRSFDDTDRWDACRRAYSSERRYQRTASGAAKDLGWDFISGILEFTNLDNSFLQMMDDNFELRRDVAKTFRERNIHVLVNENFFSLKTFSDEEYEQFLRSLKQMNSDISQLQDQHGLKFSGVDQANDIVQAATFLFVEERFEEGLSLLEDARSLAEAERGTFLDLRFRNTVVEGIPELYRNIGLVYLQHKRYEEAFETFESVRAAGLSDLATAFEAHAITDEGRLWLSRMVDAGSRESALVNGIAGDAIAGIDSPELNERLDELSQVRAERADLLADPAASVAMEAVAAAKRDPLSLSDLRAAVADSGIPVIMYWTTPVNIIVWAISPDEMEVKAVFLPDFAVADQVERLANSAKDPAVSFDTEAARQLYAFLIQPFAHHLDAKEVVIVPQGPLAHLPFELLIDPRNGEFLIDRIAVSYAPNAAFATRSLRQTPVQLSQVTAIYDYRLERDEIVRIENALSAPLRTISSDDISSHEDAISLLGSDDMVHVLLHGDYDARDPLQSSVLVADLPEDEEDLTAAEMLAADWNRVRLAVFSSCEGARVDVRLSNELYGIPWAPLVGGTEAVVMSRWRVLARNSAIWMERFYKGLAEGSKSVAVVAAETMRDIRTHGDTHPYNWAGPMVFGR